MKHAYRLLPLALILASPCAGAQTPQTLQTFPEYDSSALWAVVLSVSDLTGDGVGEFVISSPSDACPFANGRVDVYSGRDGAPLFTIHPAVPSCNFGEAVAEVGDLNADGTPDFAIGSPGGYGYQGFVQLSSGVDGSLLSLIQSTASGLGVEVIGPGDLDGDSVPDLVIACTFCAGGATARAVSGANGSLLYEVSIGASLGFHFLAIDDVDGDGIPDWVSANSTGATVRSGVDGTPLWSLAGLGGTTSYFSNPLDHAGDFDGDGVTDIVHARTNGIRIFSALSGAVLAEFAVSGAQSIAGGVDFNSDGVLDFAVGNPYAGVGGRYQVFSGADGAELFGEWGQPIPNIAAGSRLGWDIAAFLDTNCNGRPELLVSATGEYEVRHVEAALPGIIPTIGTSYCTASANSSGLASTMSAEGSACIGSNFMILRAGPMAIGEPGLFVFGFEEAQVAFGNGTRCIGGAALFRLFPFGTANANGHLGYLVDMTILPNGGFNPGDEVNFQAWYRDPAGGGAGFNLSNGLSITFQP